MSGSSAREGRSRATDRILRPVAGILRRASWMAVGGSLLWIFQAAAIAWTVTGWVDGAPPLSRAIPAAAVVAAVGILRALIDRRVGALLFDAADITIARERAALTERALQAPAAEGAGSAEIAAMVAQKIPMLGPWITRYNLAMTCTKIVPFVLIGIAAVLSWPVALIFFITLPLIPVFMALVGIAAEKASQRQLAEIGTMNDLLIERLSALLDIRLLGATDRAADEFRDRAELLREKTMGVLRIAFLSSAVLELFAALGLAMVAVFVGFSLLGQFHFGSWGHPLGLGEGLFLLLIAPEVYQPLRDLAAAWHDRAAGLAVVTEIEALEAQPGVPLLGRGGAAKALAGPLDLHLRGAVAALPGREGIALPDLDLGPGQSIALTGPSGAGKSTSLRAIAGLLPLAGGRIACGDVALSEDTADAWRGAIALIPQGVAFPRPRAARLAGPARDRRRSLAGARPGGRGRGRAASARGAGHAAGRNRRRRFRWRGAAAAGGARGDGWRPAGAGGRADGGPGPRNRREGDAWATGPSGAGARADRRHP